MAGRRRSWRDEAYDPAAALAFRWIAIVLGVVAVIALAAALGWAAAEWVNDGAWSWPLRSGLAGLVGLTAGVLCALASAFCVGAIEGPPGWRRDGEDPVADAVEARAVAEYPVDAPTAPAGKRFYPEIDFAFGEDQESTR